MPINIRLSVSGCAAKCQPHGFNTQPLPLFVAHRSRVSNDGVQFILRFFITLGNDGASPVPWCVPFTIARSALK